MFAPILMNESGRPAPDQAGRGAGGGQTEAGGDGVQTEVGSVAGTAKQGEREGGNCIKCRTPDFSKDVYKQMW